MRVRPKKKDLVYETLKQRIIRCELPPGLPINEAIFGADLGVSKTPIREALRQLERVGLVENIPSRGSTITHITSHEISDVFQIREIIESGAARRAAMSEPTEALRELRKRYLARLNSAHTVEGYVHEWGDWENMHSMVVSSLGNRLLNDVYSRLIDRILRIRNFYGKRLTQRRFIDVINEHNSVIDAIVAGRPEEAETAMQRHLQNTSVFLIGFSHGAEDLAPQTPARSQ